MISFPELVKSGVNKFSKWLDCESFFRVYAHADADGIAGAFLVTNLLKSKGKLFHLSFHDNPLINPVGGAVILIDLGSAQLSNFSEFLSKSRVLILDHHSFNESINHDNLIHVNPVISGLNGGVEVSASGVCYLFCKELMPVNPLIGLIGAFGDLQSLDSSVNSLILSDNKSGDLLLNNREIKDWALILNACARLNNSSFGVKFLLNLGSDDEINDLLSKYKALIDQGIEWFDSNASTDFVKETGKATYFIGKGMINHQIIGTLCSLKSDSGKELIVGFADYGEFTKVSVRRSSNSVINVNELINESIKGLGTGGGHAQAGGAMITKGSEDELINRFEGWLEKSFKNDKFIGLN